MKMFRSISVIFLLLAILISLSGCIIIPLYKRYDDIKTDTVSSVDIYDLRNKNTFGGAFLETETPVYTLTEEQLDGFWSDLAEIRFTDHILIIPAAVDPSFSYGDWVVRINYTDGSYSLLSCMGFGETYDENNQIIDTNHYGCDDDEWEQFISRYLPQELFEEQAQDQ